jgi:hypothetical protein
MGDVVGLSSGSDHPGHGHGQGHDLVPGEARLRARGGTPEYVQFNAGDGTRFTLFPTRAASGAGHTVLSFEVDNVEKVVEELKGRGVVFEEYDMPDFKTVDGIGEIEGFKGGWFKDSEDNVIAIGQRT